MGRMKKDPSATSTSACRVCGLLLDSLAFKRYNIKCLICPVHQKAFEVLYGGMLQRFCHQCRKLHPLHHFDGKQRNCMQKLAMKRGKDRQKRLSEMQVRFSVPQQTQTARLARLRMRMRDRPATAGWLWPSPGACGPGCWMRLGEQNPLRPVLRQSSPAVVCLCCTPCAQAESRGSEEHRATPSAEAAATNTGTPSSPLSSSEMQLATAAPEEPAAMRSALDALLGPQCPGLQHSSCAPRHHISSTSSGISEADLRLLAGAMPGSMDLMGALWPGNEGVDAELVQQLLAGEHRCRAWCAQHALRLFPARLLTQAASGTFS